MPMGNLKFLKFLGLLLYINKVVSRIYGLYHLIFSFIFFSFFYALFCFYWKNTILLKFY